MPAGLNTLPACPSPRLQAGGHFQAPVRELRVDCPRLPLLLPGAPAPGVGATSLSTCCTSQAVRATLSSSCSSSSSVVLPGCTRSRGPQGVVSRPCVWPAAVHTSGAAPGRSCEEGLLARSDPSSSLPASSDEVPWSLTRQVSSSSFFLRVSSSLSASVGSRPARHCSGQGDPRSAGHPRAPGRRGALGGVRSHCPEELVRRARAGPVPGSGARLCRGGGGGTPADPDATQAKAHPR